MYFTGCTGVVTAAPVPPPPVTVIVGGVRYPLPTFFNVKVYTLPDDLVIVYTSACTGFGPVGADIVIVGSDVYPVP
jgi:hypothetical protein